MIWVIGKNASIETFPTGFFDDKETIGLNDAALTFKTTWAFSCYPRLIKEFLANGYTLERIIGVSPKYGIPDQRGKDIWPNRFPGILNDPLVYDNHTPGKIADVAKEMAHLFNSRDKEFPYHNVGTCAQLVIYWCVLQNKFPICMCGCNQDANCAKCYHCTEGTIPGKICPVKTDAWKHSRLYTREVARCLNLYGDVVRFYDSYAEYLQKEKSNDPS